MKPKQIFSAAHFLFGGILFLILLLLCYLGRFLSWNRPQIDAKSRIASVENMTDATLPESEDMGDGYLEKITFLGESTTYGFWHYGVLKDGKNSTQVWTGATVQNGKVCCSGTLSLSPSITKTKIFFPDSAEALTISEALDRTKPEILVITLGLNNGASYYTEDMFKECYRMLLNSVKSTSPNTTVLLGSLFPVAKNCQIGAYTPERIQLCNTWIHDLALEYELGYLNTYSVLSDAEGYLRPEYDNGGDGIHLNREGLETVLNYIRTHGHSKEKI